jgi:hypothetical protein
MPNAPIMSYRPSRCNYIYVCKVDADGSFLIGPENWGVTKTGLGAYIITHDLGHTNYVFLPIVSGTYRSVPTVSAFDDATVTVNIYDNGQLADMPFQLVVMTTQQ